jgi:transketolase
MRDVYGKKLAELGKRMPDLAVLDADVAGSTRSSFFAAAFPERFFNCGAAEGNMAGVAAGLAACGRHPVINAFSIFLALKSTDQIRNDICYNRLPAVIAGAYGGLSDSFDGASHQSVADIAVFRALPNMEVIVPADNSQVERALEYALDRRGPVYIRICRNETPDLPAVFPSAADFAERKPLLLRRGGGPTIAAAGTAAAAALGAAEILAGGGLNPEVFSVPFVKPASLEILEASVRKTGVLVTVEEHNILGGAGSAWLESLSRGGLKFSWLPIGIEDRFGESGPYEALLEANDLNAAGIALKVKQFMDSLKAGKIPTQRTAQGIEAE